MRSEWRTLTLGQLGRIVTGKTPKTSDADNFGDQVPFVTPSDMDGKKVIGKTARYLSELGASSVKNSIISAGSVLVSCIGSDMGKAAIAKHRCVTNQQINSIEVSSEFCSDFIYYNLSNRKTELQHLASGGSTMPILNKGMFSELKIDLPPLKSQIEIAATLSSFDDRIALLRETNATLEAIAQALFKSWFIDFDPVRAKQQGQMPEGMDEATAALFPDSFEESELGLLPKGWDVSMLGNVAHVIDCLHSKKPELLADGWPFLQLSNIRDDGLLDTSNVAFIREADYLKWISRIEVCAGDCVITNVGRVGAVSQIPSGFKAAIGRNMTAIRLKSEFPYPTFLIQLLKSPWMKGEIQRRTDVGTILDALNVRNIPSLRFSRASDEILSAYEGTFRPIQASMEENLSRINLLSNLRDTLLPRLISGQLRITEAEEAFEEVTA